MPLYQPTNIFPSSFAGTGGGTVDAARPITISWQVNGNSAMTGYQIEIYENTTASTRVFNSGKVTISPFWGTNSQGEVQYFSAEIRPSLTNGFTAGYKMRITQYWDGGSVQQSSPSYFITRSAPMLSIQPFSNPLTGRAVTFRASYTQAQGDALDFFHWMLADEGGVLEDSGNIYGSGDLQVSYDGLFTDTQYRVRCLIQTENGVQADTGWVDFTVKYAVSDMLGYVEAYRHPVEGIALRWPLVSYIPGKPSGPNSIEGGNLNLLAGSTVTWDERNGEPMRIPAPWSMGWSGIVPTSGTTPVLTLAGDHTVTFHIVQKYVWLALDGADLLRVPIPGVIDKAPWRFVLTPREGHLYYLTAEGGLLPADGLYPANDLYPNDSKYAWRRVTIPLTWVQPVLEGITLHGAQICHWITIIKGEVSGGLLNSMLTDFSWEPSWELDTWFLATFDQALNGGNITPIGDRITGVALYRRGEGTSKLELVANLEIGTSELVDLGFRNQETYTYYLFVLGANTYVSAPLISNPITPMFWNWTVLDTQWEGGAYHVKAAHLFANSVSTDSISNNNTPQLLQNFTPYPTRQPSSYNYRSSTLTGYIGRVDFMENRYIDTVEMAEEIWALSVSSNPKFLRDRKGNLWRVETGAAVSFQTGDKQAPQPYFGSFPWVEVGPVDGPIISGADDWDGDTEAMPDILAAAIVVTAETGSTVTITGPDGRLILREVSNGYVTYPHPADGDYIVRAEKGKRNAQATVSVREPVTYYVGLILEEPQAVLVISAPSGALVTVSGPGYTESKVVP